MPWLGPSFQGLLLADAPTNLLRYDECDPRAGPCPGRVQLQRERACRRFQLDAPERRVRYHVRAGALVSEAQHMLTVYTGSDAVPVFIESGRNLKAALLRALRPQPGQRLAPPRLPPKVLARLAETERQVRRLGRAGARRALRIGPRVLKNRVALSRILRRLHRGTPRAARC